MKFIEWRRYSDMEVWQSEGREILDNGNQRFYVWEECPSAHLQQNHASDLNLSIT